MPASSGTSAVRQPASEAIAQIDAKRCDKRLSETGKRVFKNGAIFCTEQKFLTV
ncbi:MAG: hypothetical protein IKP81_09095 [Paludibacteraceae bacterium]|nr:hypothetical protein [Paludibacteraceae bacterium]MBR6105196.1 hypothetical protein [Paludibacteraceae bacterium]